jgi:transaldolase
MRIFLATASVDVLRWGVECGLADGTLAAPSLLGGDHASGRRRISELLRAFPLPLIASAGTGLPDDLYREGKDLARLSDHLIVEVPFGAQTVATVHRLSDEGIRVAASMLFTPVQVLLAAKAGASMLLIHVGALDALGQEGARVIAESRALLDQHRLECDLIAVLPENATQFSQCALAGADGAVLDPYALRDFLLHPLIDRGFDALMQDAAARARARLTP